jgi:hypothetical protein
MKLLFVDLKKKKRFLPISHPISILNTVQRALLHLNLKTQITRKRKEHWVTRATLLLPTII